MNYNKLCIFVILWLVIPACRAFNPVVKNNRSIDSSLLIIPNSAELVRSATGDKLVLRLKTKMPATCRIQLMVQGENIGDRETEAKNCTIEYPRLSFLELLPITDPQKNYSIDVKITPDPELGNAPPAEWISLSERSQNTNSDREIIRVKYDSFTGAGEINKLEFSTLDEKNQAVQLLPSKDFECKKSKESFLESVWSKARPSKLSIQKVGSTGFAIINQLRAPSDADSTLRFHTKVLTKSERWEIGFEENNESQVIIAPAPALWNSVELKSGDQNKSLDQGKDLTEVSIQTVTAAKNKDLNLQWAFSPSSDKAMVLIQLVSTKNEEIIYNCFGPASKLSHSLSTNNLSGEFNFYIALVDRQAVDVANYQGAAWMIESFDWRTIKLQF